MFKQLKKQKKNQEKMQQATLETGKKFVRIQKDKYYEIKLTKCI